MPRDLEQERKPVQIFESPNSTAMEYSQDESPSSKQLVKVDPSEMTSQGSSDLTLHPYTRPLTINDVDSCVALENAAFTNEDERCTREKVSLLATFSYHVLRHVRF